MPNVGSRVFLQSLSFIPHLMQKPPPCSSEHTRPQPFPGCWAASGAAFWNLHIPDKLSFQAEGGSAPGAELSTRWPMTRGSHHPGHPWQAWPEPLALYWPLCPGFWVQDLAPSQGLCAGAGTAPSKQSCTTIADFIFMLIFCFQLFSSAYSAGIATHCWPIASVF